MFARLLLVAALLVALVFGAPSAHAGSTPATASAYGWVQRAADGTPIAGATVRIGTASAVSDAAGQFALTGFQAGDQTVSVVANGFFSESVGWFFQPGENKNLYGFWLGAEPEVGSIGTFTVPGNVTSLAHDPMTNRLAIGFDSGDVRLMSTVNGGVSIPQERGSLLAYGLSFRPDGRELAVLNNPDRVTLTLLWSGAVHFPILASGVTSVVYQDATTVLVGDESGGLARWRTTDTALLTQSAQHVGSAVSRLELSADHTVLMSLHANGAVVIWDPITLQQLKVLRSAKGAMRAHLTPDGQHVLAVLGWAKNSVYRIDIRKDKRERQYRLRTSVYDVVPLDNGAFVMGSVNGLQVRNLKNGKILNAASPEAQPVGSYVASPDGKYLYYPSMQKVVRIRLR